MNPLYSFRFWKLNRKLLSAASVVKMGLSGRLRPGREICASTPLLTPDTLYFRPRTSDMATLRELLMHGEYEFAATRLPAKAKIIDLGANIGLASRYFLTQRPDASIFSVEATPDTYRVLCRNLGLASLHGRGRTLHAAAWSSDGSVTMGMPEAGAFSRSTVGGGGEITVPSMTMQSLIAASGFERVDLMKIDIEGAETQLFGGDASWLNQVDALAIEFHDDSRQQSGFDQHLAQHGLHVIDEGGHTVYAARRRD